MRSFRLKHLAFALLVFVFMSAPKIATAEEGVFIHISSGPEEPHRVLMALNMANMMSTDKAVLVYFDIKGVEVVLKETPNITHEHFPSSRESLAKLLNSGVGVYACPGCLKAAGKTAEDLMPGIEVATKEKFFDFTEGRILTLDY